MPARTDYRGLPVELIPISWLIGRWGGIGEGQYPTIAPFRFEQIVEFATDGRPFLEYRSVSWLVDDDNQRIRPTSTETGYWRPQPDNGLEVLLVQATGQAEMWVGSVKVGAISQGEVTAARIDLHTDAILRSATSKQVDSGQRLYGLHEGRLLWTYDMSAMGLELQNHLAISLQRLA